jgi:acylphosphatase
VHGVGYRDATVRQAGQLGVLGWVRNEDDGSVLVHAEGPEDAVGKLVAFLREGPAAARVEKVAVEPVKIEGHEQFAVRAPGDGSSL